MCVHINWKVHAACDLNIIGLQPMPPMLPSANT